MSDDLDATGVGLKEETSARKCCFICVVSLPDYRIVLTAEPPPEEMCTFAWTGAEAMGKSLWEVFPSLRAILEPAINDAGTSGRAQVIHDHYFSSDAQARRWDIHVIPSQTSLQEHVTAITVLITDVTDRHRLQAALSETETRYKRIVETTSEGIWMLDADGKTVYVNRQMAEMLGYLPEEMVGRPYLNFVNEEDQQEAQNRWKRRMSGITDHYDFKLRRKDGSSLWALVTGAPIRDESGKVTCAVAMLNDITERKLAEEELGRSRRLLQDAQELAHLGSYEFELPEGEVTWSDETFRVVGRDPALGEPSPQEYLQLVHADDRQRLQSAIDEAIEHRTRLSTEYRVILPNGDIKHIQSVGQAKLDRNGKPVSFFGTILDITERKQVEEALRLSEQMHLRAAEIAEDSLAKLQAVISNMAEGLIIINTEGKIVTMNTAAQKLHGFVDREDAPQDLQQFIDEIETSDDDNNSIHPQDWPVVRAAQGEVVKDVEMQVRNRITGQTFTGCYHAIPIFDDNGEITLVVLTVEDITKRRRAQKEREKQFTLLQRALMPSKPCIEDGYRVASAYIPASRGQEIGGDFHDIFRTEAGKMGIVIGDVSGKDIEAASVAAVTRSTVRAFAYEISSAAEALTHANAVLYAQYGQVDSFVTVFLALLDLPTGEICCSSAGHPPPAILRANGSIEFLMHGSLPLGIERDYVYPEFKATLLAGDRIILYTDGVSEARRGQEMFNSGGIEHVLEGCRTCTPEEIMDSMMLAVKEWSEGDLRDDIAILVIERMSG